MHRPLFLLWAAALAALASDTTRLESVQQDPFRTPAPAYVLLFVRTDCPITNRYAPELQRISAEFAGQHVRFWLVYPDSTETVTNIGKHVEQYRFPGTPILDGDHKLVLRAHAAVAPEAAVFDASGKLVYHGRIDNRWVDVGRSRPAATVHDLEDAINDTLRGTPVAEPQTRAVGCSLADVK